MAAWIAEVRAGAPRPGAGASRCCGGGSCGAGCLPVVFEDTVAPEAAVSACTASRLAAGRSDTIECTACQSNHARDQRELS